MCYLWVIIEIDECSSSTHTCSKFANCTNTPGSFDCRCQDGYIGNGYHCQGTLFACLCMYYSRFHDGENYILPLANMFSTFSNKRDLSLNVGP